MDDLRAHTGTLIVDLRLPYSTGLKDRRRALRPLLDKLGQADFAVSQVGPADLSARVWLAICAVSGRASLLEERLDLAERMLFQSEFEIFVVSREIRTFSDTTNPG
jgi:uncharacterized protein YlxP (DUF503 family)